MAPLRESEFMALSFFFEKYLILLKVPTITKGSLVDRWLDLWFPVDEFFLVEPKGNFLFGAWYGVAAVDYVAADLNAEIAPDGAGLGFQRVRCADHVAPGEDDIVTFPHHGYDGARLHELDEPVEEGTAGQVGVVLLQQFLAG